MAAADPLAAWLDDKPADDPLAAWVHDDAPAPQHPTFARGPGPWRDDPVGDKQRRIERGTAAGQTEPPGFFAKLRAALPAGLGAHDYTEADLPILQQKPSLGDRLGGFVTGAGTQGFHQTRGEMQRDNPELWRGMEDMERNKDVIGGMALGSGVGGMTERALATAIPRAAPWIADAAAGTAGAAASGKPETIPEGAFMGATVGKLFRSLSKWAGGGAEAIKQSEGATGEDIRTLDKAGFEPSPMPFKPTRRIDETPALGPAGANESPSEALGVEANSSGRGTVGTRSAAELEAELARRDSISAGRLRAKRLRNNRPGGQGERVISADPLIESADREIASPEAQMIPSIETNMKRARGVLSGEEEEAINVHPANVKYNERGPVAVEVPETDPNYRYHEITPHDPFPTPGRERPSLSRPAWVNGKEVPQDALHGAHASRPGTEAAGQQRPMYRGGEMLTEPPGPPRNVERPLPTRFIQTLPEEYTVSAGGEEPISIGAGDVRGRVGEAPNKVKTAQALDRIRDILDEQGDVAELAGMDKKNLPMARLAHQIRGVLEEHAPDVYKANQRSHIRQTRTENTRELMNDPKGTQNAEPFGRQLAGQGEEGSKVTGGRHDRLEALRDQFPTRPGFPRERVSELMDRPRQLLAEERLQFKKLPRIGGGGGDTILRSEPFVARGLYPFLRSIERGGREGASTAAAGAGASGPEDTFKAGLYGTAAAGGAALLPYYALRKLLGKDKDDRR